MGVSEVEIRSPVKSPAKTAVPATADLRRSKPRILLCHNYYIHPGGESSVFLEQREILKEMGCDVREYTRDNHEILSKSTLGRLRLLMDTVYSRRTYREVSRLVREFRPDAAVVQNVFPLISPSIYRALSDAGVPILQNVFNYRFICPSANLFRNGGVCEACLRGGFQHAVLHRCYPASSSN